MSTILAITGGIACGKTHCSRRLAGLLGDPVEDRFDCDAEVSILLTNRKIIESLRSVVGSQIFDQDGGLNRSRLREVIFRDPKIRKKVEKILHPAVLKSALSFLKSKEEREFLVVEVPLLYEVDFPLKRNFDVVIGCSEKTQRDRLKEGRGIDSAQATQILRSQLSVQEKTERADFVIWNDGSIESMDDQVDRVAGYILQNGS